ncbi:site-specific integrase, partial [Massilia sp. DJPM01]|uniref:site-specific integrase n=1 Tax=Massilia sp. DJPM01 TaxID=3024404 RepID=UPI00259E4395
TKKERIPLDLPTLRRLFACPIYADGARTAGGAGEAQYWLPLLALFTGARLEELCQLRPEDVLEEVYFAEDETERTAWILRITDAGEGQGVKNKGLVRRVPIHASLKELGFIDYAKKAKGRARIFNELIPDTYGRESGNWSSWFNNYLRDKVGVSDERMVFHGFRHTFKDAARDCGIAEDASDAITGHSSASVGRKYGSGTYPLRPLVEAMNRYRIPGLVLPNPPA